MGYVFRMQKMIDPYVILKTEPRETWRTNKNMVKHGMNLYGSQDRYEWYKLVYAYTSQGNESRG